MKEYEIHVSACYRTSGGTTEWAYFKVYRHAENAAEAKRKVRAELKEECYKRITLDAIEA